MCFTSSKVYHSSEEAEGAAATEIKTCEEDRVVYKRLEKIKDKYFSPYVGMPYEKGKVYEEVLGKPFAQRLHPSRAEVYYYSVAYGLHCYSTVEQALRIKGMFGYDKEVVVEMVIPKGAVYYENTDKEIVTNKLEWRS